MYKKYLIVASKKDLAGVNITTQLSQFRQNPLLGAMNNKPNFDFYLIEEDILNENNLNLDKINKYDFIIFTSLHRSEKNEKTLSIHAPGNFRVADYGGQANKLCRASALFQKQLFQKLNENADKHNMREYKITLECTHHGPLINKPCVFIEIGSTEAEWKDRRAGFVIAKTIRDIIEDFKENPYNEIAVGIGGPHYCPNFNKIQLNSNIALAHIIPSYILPLDENLIKEALEKTEEEVDFVLLDWKGLGGSVQKQQILKLLDRLYIQWKKTSEIPK